MGRNVRRILCGVLVTCCLAAAPAAAEKFRAGGNIATAAVAKAPADGHHILFSTSNSLTGNFYLYKNLPFTAADFAPLTTLGQSAFIAIVGRTSPVRSIAELTDFLRQRGGTATFATATSFSLTTTQLYLSLTDTTARRVPYKTTPGAVNDLLGGRIDFMFADAVLAVAQARNGEVRLLAVTSSQRIAAAPNVPTLQEAGVAGYDMTAWLGAFVPVATPAETRRRLEDWLNQIARTDETRALSAAPRGGSLSRVGRTPGARPTRLQREMAANRRPSRPRAASSRLNKGAAARPPLAKSSNFSSILAIY